MAYLKEIQARTALYLLAAAAMLAVLSVVFLGPKKEKMPSLPETEGALVSAEKVKGVRVYLNGEIAVMDMEDYVAHTLAAEMNASFDAEALTANAVAIRTYLYHRLFYAQGCPSHADADVCSDPQCCQWFLTDNELKQRWKDEYEIYWHKILTSVQVCKGEILCYDGAPALTLYHSNSVGATASCAAVFGSEAPYLISVETPTDVNAEYYSTVKSYTAEGFVSVVAGEYPDVRLTPRELRNGVAVISRGNDGRVESLAVGQIRMTGTEARALFGLKSANFTVEVSGNAVTFRVLGSGHGVGLSQVGANVMARNGASYREILEHYYVGTQLAEIPKDLG